MQNYKKRELILDAMQELMNEASAQTITVSDIAKKAGIGKGSIYYYFDSKNDIIEALIERSYSRVIEQSKHLVASPNMDPFKKMEVLFGACLASSLELRRQEASATFVELQQSALLHQKFVNIITKNFKPLLADILSQASQAGVMKCQYPEEVAEIVLIVLTVKLDNHLLPSAKEEVMKVLKAFSWMQESSMGLAKGQLGFLTEMSGNS